MENLAFKLNWDFNHSEDPGKDAFCWNKQKYLDLAGDMYSTTREISLPKTIYFQANLDLIPRYDYPLTDLRIPILSKKMLSTLINVKEFEFRSTPIVMIDFRYLDYPFDSKEQLKSDVQRNYDYVAIQIMEYSDCFDYKNSVFEMFLSRVSYISKLVLKCPIEGFPPVFILKECPFIFVSKDAKEALEANGIKGCVFEPVEVTTLFLI